MQGWIKSRKLSVNSLKRHVNSNFKIRQFSLIQNVGPESNLKYASTTTSPLFEDFVCKGYSVLLVQSSMGQISQDKLDV